MCFTVNLAKSAYPNVKCVKEVGRFHDYLIKNGKKATLNHSLITENVNTCCAGVINAGKENYMFHAAPEMQPVATIKKDLEKAVNTLRETCDDVKAFICGGLELDNNNKESVASFNLYNTIADTLDELGVKFTMMCGKRRGAPMENIYAVNESTTVWSEAFKDLLEGKPKLSRDEILAKLEERYQFVESNAENILNVK